MCVINVHRCIRRYRLYVTIHLVKIKIHDYPLIALHYVRKKKDIFLRCIRTCYEAIFAWVLNDIHLTNRLKQKGIFVVLYIRESQCRLCNKKKVQWTLSKLTTSNLLSDLRLFPPKLGK